MWDGGAILFETTRSYVQKTMTGDTVFLGTVMAVCMKWRDADIRSVSPLVLRGLPS